MTWAQYNPLDGSPESMTCSVTSAGANGVTVPSLYVTVGPTVYSGFDVDLDKILSWLGNTPGVISNT